MTKKEALWDELAEIIHKINILRSLVSTTEENIPVCDVICGEFIKVVNRRTEILKELYNG